MTNHCQPRAAQRRVAGFSLIIVVILAAAATAAATALFTMYGAVKTSAVVSKAGDMSRAIAESGLALTVAYLQRNTPRDFDSLLDPGFNASCTAPGSGWVPPSPCTSAEATGCYRPVPTTDFGMGSIVYTDQFSGAARPYREVPYNGGAFFVTFDDDSDDLVPDEDSGAWSGATNNTFDDGLGNLNCKEGSALGGADNPARDRNLTMWITVVGIFPGTDPATAKQRTVLRKLHNQGTLPLVAGIQVKGEIEVEGNGLLLACSPIGSVECEGEFEGSGCACGETKGDSFSTQWEHCTDRNDSPGCDDFGIGCADGELMTPGPTIAPVGAVDAAGPAGTDFYVDWSRPCVFYLDAGNKNLWFWDAKANRGPCSSTGSGCVGAPCGSTMEGRNLGLGYTPDPTATGDPDSYKRCWTLLIKDMDSTCTWMGPGAPEVDTADGCKWRPKNTAASEPVAAMNSKLAAAGMPIYPTSLDCSSEACSGSWDFEHEGVVNKPAWADECFFSYPPFPTAGLPQQDVSCTTCDGSHNALGWYSGNFFFDGSSKENLNSVPAGVYIFTSAPAFSGATPGYSWDPDGSGTGDNAPPDPSSTSPYFDGWPRASILTTGSPDFQAPSTTYGYWFGVGQAYGNPDKTGARYISFATNGKLKLRGDAASHVAGSLYSTDDFEWSGSNTNWFYGEIHLNGDFSIHGDGKYVWKYTVGMQRLPYGTSAMPLNMPMPQ